MQQGYRAQTDFDGASLAFKRHILERTAMFESEPETDLFRVGALGEMLDRYDVLMGKGLSHESAVARVMDEFSGIAQRMSEEGFEPMRAGRGASGSRLPELSEDDAARYIEQSGERAKKQALGTALCAGCVGGIGIGAGIDELLFGMGNVSALLGVAAMFVMIGIGVYTICSASRPDDEARVKGRRFRLSPRLRKKLRSLRELKAVKSRKRRALGIALCSVCVLPLMIFGMFDADAAALFGLAGMFAMIGYGVHEIMMASSECKAVDELLCEDEPGA